MILLTGASGFIGKYLLSALVRGEASNVLALTSNPISECPYLLHKNYSFDNDYFVKSNYASSIDTIIHAGAFTPKNATQANDWQHCYTNIENTSKLLTANLPNLQKVIYLSTLDVYGETEIISEKSIIDPVSLYGDSKLYGEKMIAAWANSENKTCQVLRIGHVYGPGEEAYQKIIPVAIKKILTEQPIQIFGTGNELRSFIYIKDIVSAILHSLKLEENIGPINLVSNQIVSINELVEKLFFISGKKTKIEFVSKDIIGRNLIFDNAKMKQYLLSSEIPLNEGLLEEWLYMKQISG